MEVPKPKIFHFGPMAIDGIISTHVVVAGPPNMSVKEALELVVLQAQMQKEGESPPPDKLEYL